LAEVSGVVELDEEEVLYFIERNNTRVWEEDKE
jgi:hypothetical protein